jgi:hypothetical protein
MSKLKLLQLFQACNCITDADKQTKVHENIQKLDSFIQLRKY